MSAEEYFTLGGVPDGALHEERGYMGVCACVLREGMVESRMDLAGAVRAQLPFVKAGEETLGMMALVMVLAQFFVLLGTVVYVQRELKQTFDESGRRRQ